MNKKIAVILGSCLVTSIFATTILTPNSNQNSGTIPSGYTALDFNLSDGNWVENLYLPKNAKNNDVVKINSSASYASYLDATNTDLPIESLKVLKGSSYSFIYNSTAQKWLVSINASYPINDIADFIVPVSNVPIQQVTVKDGAWSKQITLPNSANDGALIRIISTALYNSKINTANLLFPSSYILKKGDDFWFKYNVELKKWVPESIKPYPLNASSVGARIQTINAPVTEVNFADGNYVASTQLPASANDRDRVIFKSTATLAATISNSYTNTQATLKLKNGDRYEFMYVADKSQWVLVSAPEVTLQAKDLSNKQIPNTKQPTTRIKFANANWQSSLNLPLVAKAGDKVILNSLADWNSTVTANNGLSQVIKKGESQRYVYTATGWVKDSYTIDTLLVSSTAIADKLGASAAKVRIYEGADLTNISAENSQAQFYVRPVGYLSYKVPTTDNTLGQAIDKGRTDTTIQSERNRLLADAVYYEGTEDGCGLAWVNVTPSASDMFGSGSRNCGTGVMRHEFGHNMGLNHNDSNTIGQGFSNPLGSTVMGGNSLPYYSSPNLYHPKYGYRLGLDGKIDSVSLLNKNAPLVAAFK